MKKIIYRLIIFILIIGFVYILFFSIFKLKKGEIGIVEDLRNGRIVRIFSRKYNFIWQGIGPWVFSVNRISAKKYSNYDITIPLPGFEVLKNDNYSIKIPVKVIYRINTRSFFHISSLRNEGKGLEKLVKKSIKGVFVKELYPFLSPAYKVNALNIKKDAIVENSITGLKKEMQKIGLDLIDINISGGIYFPDRRIYNEGRQYLSEMRRVVLDNEKKLKIVYNNLEKGKIESKQLYKKLLEISRIIRGNPDILKYIYIDKMADNVKVIHSSANLGLKDLFDNRDAIKKVSKKGEIDNLR